MAGREGEGERDLILWGLHSWELDVILWISELFIWCIICVFNQCGNVSLFYKLKVLHICLYFLKKVSNSSYHLCCGDLVKCFFEDFSINLHHLLLLFWGRVIYTHSLHFPLAQDHTLLTGIVPNRSSCICPQLFCVWHATYIATDLFIYLTV